MQILFFSHYFPPEVNAPASRTYEHCLRWVQAGHEVTVVTCAPNCPDGVLYEGYRNALRPQVHQIDGIRVVRVWTYLAPNAGTLRRIVNFLSYMVMAVLASIRLPRPDVVVATSPQFFCGWAGVWVSRLKRVPFVLEIRDIWPESIQAVGALRSRVLLRLLEWLERRMYRAAAHIVAVGRGYRDNIAKKMACSKPSSPRPLAGEGPGVRAASTPISVITNGVDLDRFAPREPDARFLHQHDLESKFVCSYIGTIGMAHGLEVVLKTAELLKKKGRKDIAFCLVGDGAHAERLKAAAVEQGLDDLVVFAGRQPKEEIPYILASSDCCLIHLRGCELFGTVIPSKIFETLAMARPIVMGVRGEACDIVQEAGAGIVMEPDNPESLLAAVEQLADHPDLTLRLGQSARDYVAEHFDRSVLAARYLTLLHKVAGVEEAEPIPQPVKHPKQEVASQS